MVQIQSSWYQLIGRNLQTYVDNILEAEGSSFTKLRNPCVGREVIQRISSYQSAGADSKTHRVRRRKIEQ